MIRLVGAVLAERQVSRRYFRAESPALLAKPKEVQQIKMLQAS